MARGRTPPPVKGKTMTPGDRAVGFINNLCHTDGRLAGTPFHLRDWQENIIRRFFGTINPETGLRQYRTLYIEIPRKNGKSELIAAVALYLLLGDGEYSAQIYGAAADRGQAAIIFNVATKMVMLDRELTRRVKLKRSIKTMEYLASMSFYMAISKESSNKHGFNAHGILIDEYHTFVDDELFDVLSTSQDAREQPVRVIITTAGEPKRKGVETPAYKLHKRALRVLQDPSLDPTFLPIIYAASEDDPWEEPATWYKANPALGDFKKIEGLYAMAREAQDLPAKRSVFKRLHLNIWDDEETKAISTKLWNENSGDVIIGGELPDFLLGRKCYGGLDLASTSDICALVLFFPPDKNEAGEFDGKFHVYCRFWLPTAAVKKRTTKDIPYKEWVEAGLITTTEGDVTDYNAIRDAIAGRMPNDGTNRRRGGLIDKVRIHDIGYDRWNSSQLVNDLVEDGANMVSFGQGFFAMAAPTKELFRILLKRQLAHGSNPVLAWMADNMSVESDDADNHKPSKKKSAEKIDGMVALIMAIGRFLADNQPKKKSRFSNPGGKRRPTAEDVEREAQKAAAEDVAEE